MYLMWMRQRDDSTSQNLLKDGSLASCHHLFIYIYMYIHMCVCVLISNGLTHENCLPLHVTFGINVSCVWHYIHSSTNLTFELNCCTIAIDTSSLTVLTGKVSCLTTNKLHGLSPRANYTDRTTAAWRSDCQLLRIKGATWSAWRIPTDVFSVF
jgi:hypothetical protein